MLMTRWVLGNDRDNDHGGVLQIYDVGICEEDARDLASHDKDDKSGEFETDCHEAISQSEEALSDTGLVGNWIIESPEAVGKEYDLNNPHAPNTKRLARSYRLYKVLPLILF
jgi:hypothetical protein